MNADSYGPTFRWFAWRPTFTRDRGWRWLRLVKKRRWYASPDSLPAMAGFETAVEEF